jgi:uncharacterized membrane protein YqjE
MSDTPAPAGLFTSLRRLLADALDLARVRLELLGNEVELEKQRLLEGLLRGALALMLLGVGLALLCGFVVLLFWDGYRLAALGALTLLSLGAGAALLRSARLRLERPDGMLPGSLGELRQDIEQLRAARQHGQP